MRPPHRGDLGPGTLVGQGASSIAWPSLHAGSRSERGSELRGSFLEQFNHATLGEPANTWEGMADQEVSAAHIQTPPPTRDANSRRKPLQPQIRYATPSTTGSRRKSTPASSWLKRTADQAPLDVSPLQFSPVDFSPASVAPFHSGGAATAPAQPHGSIFWDSSNHDEMDFSFPTVHEDPFAPALLDDAGPPFTQSSPVMPKYSATKSRQLLHNNKPTLEQWTRPQTARLARPATTAEASIDGAVSFFPSSGVDPNVLWSSNKDSTDRLAISEATPSERSRGEAPYQFHFDEKRREKEDRLLRTSLQQQRRTSQGSSAISHTSKGLRRSVTDSKARRGHGSLQTFTTTVGDMREITASLQNAHIPRESSPLKRQRMNQHAAHPTDPQTRKTVVLTVDDKGRAKTVFQPVQQKITPPSQIAANSTDASSQPDSLSRSASHSRQESLIDEVADDVTDTPARSNAQEALWQMRRERQQRRKGLANRSVSARGFG